MENHLERRHLSRYHSTGASEILLRGESWEWGKVRDINRRCCYIETMHPLAAGTEAHLRLMIAGSFLDIHANVVFSDPMFGMKMDFVRTEQWSKLTQTPASRLRVRVAIAFKSIEKVKDVNLLPVVPHNVGGHGEARPYMQAALQHLQQAQRELREAMRAFHGGPNTIQ